MLFYDLNKKSGPTESEDKAKAYGIQYVPAIAINGKLIALELLNRSGHSKSIFNAFGEPWFKLVSPLTLTPPLLWSSVCQLCRLFLRMRPNTLLVLLSPSVRGHAPRLVHR